MIKFATYNIQYGVGQDGRYDLARVIAELQDQDVICLQEVTTHWSTCNRDVQSDLLAYRYRWGQYRLKPKPSYYCNFRIDE